MHPATPWPGYTWLPPHIALCRDESTVLAPGALRTWAFFPRERAHTSEGRGHQERRQRGLETVTGPLGRTLVPPLSLRGPWGVTNGAVGWAPAGPQAGVSQSQSRSLLHPTATPPFPQLPHSAWDSHSRSSSSEPLSLPSQGARTAQAPSPTLPPPAPLIPQHLCLALRVLLGPHLWGTGVSSS